MPMTMMVVTMMVVTMMVALPEAVEVAAVEVVLVVAAAAVADHPVGVVAALQVVSTVVETVMVGIIWQPLLKW